MALKSMTAYALVEEQIDNHKCTLEIRSVNGRFLDSNIKIPKELASLEFSLKQTLKQHIARGSVSVYINFTSTENHDILALNQALLQQYLHTAQLLEKEHHVKNDLAFSHFLQIPDFFHEESTISVQENTEVELQNLLLRAIEKLNVMRSQEGAFLEKDLRQRVEQLNDTLKEIEVLAPKRIIKWHDNFSERLQQMCAELIPQERISQEAGILADRLDISEEITRFYSHNELFLQTLDENTPQGKKLNFILQEMGREANTLGTKSQDAAIAKLAITLKDEVESMREQVQNIE